MRFRTGLAQRLGMPLLAIATAGCLVAVDATPSLAHRSEALVLTGRGFGHGRGMGQWGARGAALDGVAWTRILSHYYRGVRITRSRAVATMRVRVQVSRRMMLWSSHPYTVKAGGDRTAIRRPEATVRVRRSGSSLIVERARRRSGPWRRVSATTGRVTIEAGDASLWLYRPGGGLRAYASSLVITRRREQLSAVNHLPRESYVASVLPREMPASWPKHALRAQAVAVRTYAMNVASRARRAGMSYDICASTGCQVFGGVAWRRSMSDPPVRSMHPRANEATRATANRIMTYRGKPIFAQYSSSTGGYSDRGDAPYLRAVPDRWDRGSPHHLWREVIDRSALERRWPSIGALRRVRVIERNGYGTWGGRVRRIVVEGSEGRVGLSGDRFQAVFGLRSDWFSIRWRGYRYTRNMGEGTRGHDVWHLQHRLRQEGVYPKNAPHTTYFGPITRESLKRYQRAHGIRATGYLGPQTRRSLNRRA